MGSKAAPDPETGHRGVVDDSAKGSHKAADSGAAGRPGHDSGQRHERARDTEDMPGLLHGAEGHEERCLGGDGDEKHDPRAGTRPLSGDAHHGTQQA